MTFCAHAHASFNCLKVFCVLTFPLLSNCRQKVVSQSSASSLQREFHFVAFNVHYRRRLSV